MTTIIGGREKLRRADAKVEGRADRREHRLEWRGLARQMQADALAAGETRFMARIAREVEVDVRQVSRLLTGELQRDPLMVETRGRRGRKKRPTGTMVRIVVARRGGLSRSVWVNADQAEADNVALRKAMDRDRTSKFVPRPAFDPDVDVDLGDESRIQTMTSTCFGPQWLGSVAIAFPNRVNRVVFSITRKREEKKRALARETQSEVFQAGGPRAKLKPKAIPTIQRNSAPPATSTQPWTGWGPLIKVGAARTGITGNRQANQKPIASEGWVKITRADGKTKSIRILPLPKTTRATRAKAPTPIYMDAKTGEIDFVLMRAEAARITQEQKVAKEAARIRDVALDEAQHAQGALAAANHLKEIRERAMSKSKSVEPN